MRKLGAVFVVFTATCVFGCSSPKFFMGMDEKEFKQKNSGLTLIEATEHYSAYRKVNYPFLKPAMTKFFHFKDGRLVKVDEGMKAPDIIIESR